MKVKTSELVGPALNWATGVAGGTPGLHVVNKPGKVCVYGTLRMPSGELLDWPVQPSTDWSQGGPIIEREKIETYWHTGLGMWAARHGNNLRYGATPLIAAMRCYVSSKLGDEVDIPEELI